MNQIYYDNNTNRNVISNNNGYQLSTRGQFEMSYYDPAVDDDENYDLPGVMSEREKRLMIERKRKNQSSIKPAK